MFPSQHIYSYRKELRKALNDINKAIELAGKGAELFQNPAAHTAWVMELLEVLGIVREFGDGYELHLKRFRTLHQLLSQPDDWAQET